MHCAVCVLQSFLTSSFFLSSCSFAWFWRRSGLTYRGLPTQPHRGSGTPYAGSIHRLSGGSSFFLVTSGSDADRGHRVEDQQCESRNEAREVLRHHVTFVRD